MTCACFALLVCRFVGMRKSRAKANPYDPEWEPYFETRLGLRKNGRLPEGKAEPASSLAGAKRHLSGV